MEIHRAVFNSTYLQHSVTIAVGKRGFKTAEAGAIILIKIKFIVTETWIFHLDFTITLRYGHKGAVICFRSWVPREKLCDYSPSFFQIVRYLQKRYYLFFFNQSNVFCFFFFFFFFFYFWDQLLMNHIPGEQYDALCERDLDHEKINNTYWTPWDRANKLGLRVCLTTFISLNYNFDYILGEICSI